MAINKTLKTMRLILFILLLIPFLGLSQKYTDPLLFGRGENGIYVTRSLAIPSDTVTPPVSVQNRVHVAFKNGVLYRWDSAFAKYWVSYSAGGGGANNLNVGAGFRLLKPGDQTIKTVYAGEGQLIDSTTNTDGLTFKTIDTINAIGVRSVADLIATDYHVINAAYKKKNSNDKPVIKLLGWRSPGDGGGGNLYYDDTSTAAVDSGMVFRPLSIPVGQPGRLKRILETPEVNVLWFGAIRHDSRVIGDIVDTAINSLAFKRAMNALPLLDVGGTVQKAGHKILVPRGTYWLDTTWVIDRAAWIIGDAGSQTTVGARLIFPNGTSGLHVYPADPIIVPARTGGACTIQGIWADSYFSNRYSSDTLGHGFKIKSTSTLRDCKASNFAGNGFDFNSDGGMIGTDSFGNNGLTLVEKCRAEGNKNGFYTHGGDANIIHFTDCDATANLGWGYWEDAFLGNLYVNCHAADNTYATGNKSQVFHGGKQYIALAYSKGIEPGVTSGWENYFVDVGAPFSTYFQDWHADTLYRGGGSYNSWPGQNGQNMYLSCYAEGGQPAMFGPRTMVLGGVTNAMIFPTGVAANRDMSMVASNGAYYWNAPIRWQKATYPLRWEMGFDGMKFSPMEGWPYEAYSYRFNYDSTIRKFQSYYESPISYQTFNVTTHGTNPTDYGLSASNPGMIEFPRGVNIGRQVTGGYRRLAFGTGPPNSGEWATGDFILNAITGTGDTTLGWRCTSGGSQGTWEIIRVGQSVTGGSGGSGGLFVDSIWRTPGKDSIQFSINGVYHAILDSTGGGGGGSGTVNSGSQYELAFYPNTGTTVDGNTGITTNVNNGLYVSSADGQPFSISSTSSTGFSGSGFYRPAKFMTPNMTAGQTSQIFFGKAENSNDAMAIDFLWNGTSSTSNRIDLGFYGQSIVKLFASGNVGINAASDIGEKFYVNGDAHVGTHFSATKGFFGGLSSPSALLDIGPGTAVANTGPLRFTVLGAKLLTVPERGLMEVWQDSLYYTDSNQVRHRVAFDDMIGSSFYTNNGTVTGERTVTQGANKVIFTSTGTQNISIENTNGGLPLGLNISDAGTANSIPILTKTRLSTGTVANGFGVSDVTNLESANGTQRPAVELHTSWQDATDATRKAVYDIYISNGGSQPLIAKFRGTGQLQFPLYTSPASFTGTPAASLQTTSAGDVISGPILESSTYTPTGTSVTNIGGSAIASGWTYIRVGNNVSVSGELTLTPSSAAACEFGLTLPIASNLAGGNELNGVATSSTLAAESGALEADATNDRAAFKFVAATTTQRVYKINFTYRIL